MTSESVSEQKTALEAQVTELQELLRSLEQSKTEALCVAEQQTITLREHLQSQVDSYKEQSQQYALTITAMEEKLLALMQKQQLLERENESLKQQASKETKIEEKEEEEEKEKLEKLEQLIKTLRQQLAQSNREGEQCQRTIQGLREEIEEKNHTEDHLKAQHSNEVEDMRKTLSLQENVAENQRQELCELRGKLEERLTELTSLTEQHRRREEEMATHYREQLERAEKEMKKKGGQLLEVGERCLGEHHTQILARQKEALSQLRQRLKDTDDRKPTEASHKATLGELERVREELIEERAKRHFEAGGSGQQSNEAPASDPVIDALNCCEDSYFQLVDSVCERGFLKRPEQRRIPLSTRSDEQEALVEERRKFAEKVAKKIKAAAKQEKGRDQNTDSGDESSESEDSEAVVQLKSQLEAVNEELEQQKRLNLALVKRKEFREQQAAKVSRSPQRSKTAAI